MNLMIVNDEVMTADTMQKEIAWHEYGIDQVFTAYNVQSAKELARSETIEIMLCDIEMPGESGIDLLQWVREQNIKMECVFLTCHANFEYAKSAIGLGCQDYILMPAKYEEVGQLVQKIVNRLKEENVGRKLQEYGKQYLDEQVNQAEKLQGESRDAKDVVIQVKKYIRKNLGKESLGVKELAEAFYLHPVYLNRIFKREAGSSISQYIIKERMELAGFLLEAKHLQPGVVAERVGYPNYQNFNTAFKKYHGCAPSHYGDRNTAAR